MQPQTIHRAKKLSVVVVSYNSAHLLTTMFEALNESAHGIDFECIAIDNASRDNSAESITELCPEAYLIKNRTNVGFGRANNQAIPHITGKYVLLLNTDAFVAKDTLEKTIAFMDCNPTCGVLGVRLTDRDGSLQPSARYFPTPTNLFLQRTGLSKLLPGVRLVDDMNWDHNSVRLCDWVPGCYLLIRKEVIDKVGLFDPRYFLYFEEVDFCKSVKREGWQVAYFPGTSVIHIGGESAKSDGDISKGNRQLEALQIESELLYIRKHHGLVTLFGHLGASFAAEIVSAMRNACRLHPLNGVVSLVRRVGLQWHLVIATMAGSRNTR